MESNGKKYADKFFQETIPMIEDCVKGCIAFTQSIKGDTAETIYLATSLNKSLSALIERCMREGTKKFQN